jgi:hypothetical protein
LPQARYVLVGAAAGELPKRRAAIFSDLETGTAFAAAAAAIRPPEPEPAPPAPESWISEEPAEPEIPAPVAEAPAPAPQAAPAPPTPPVTPPPAVAPPAATPFAYPEIDQDDGIPAPPSLAAFTEPTPAQDFGIRFGEMAPLAEPPGFGIPQIPPVTAPGSGWQWEPPEDDEPEGFA